MTSFIVAVPIRPKPMAVGGRVFGKDGWEPTLWLIIPLIISYRRNGNASKAWCRLDIYIHSD